MTVRETLVGQATAQIPKKEIKSFFEVTVTVDVDSTHSYKYAAKITEITEITKSIDAITVTYCKTTE